jgi:plastocyanin
LHPSAGTGANNPTEEAELKPPTSRALASFLCAALTATALAACGDEAEDTQSLTFTLSGKGKAAKIAVPESAEAGLAEITFRNDGKADSDLQLIRVEGDRSAQEVVDGLGKAMKGQAFPEWFFAGGGVGPTAPGQSRTVTQVLEPGTYYAFDTEGSQGPPDAKSAASVEVSGEESDEEVEADGTISAFEYGFESDGVSADATEVLFENKGAQPHHIVYAPLRGDDTAEDVEEFLDSEKGKPPFEEKDVTNTAVIEGGESQLVPLDLKPGRYALLCFVSDRQGSKPHALKGMVGEVEVE